MSSVVGVGSIIVTVIMGFLGSFGLYLVKQENKRMKLRRAFHAELKTMEGELGGWASMILEGPQQEGIPVYSSNPIVRDVYEGNMGELGSLSTDEVEKLTHFYSLASRVSAQREIVQGGDAEALTRHMLLLNVVNLYDYLVQSVEILEDQMGVELPSADRYEHDFDSEEIEERVKERLGAEENSSQV